MKEDVTRMVFGLRENYPRRIYTLPYIYQFFEKSFLMIFFKNEKYI